MKKVLVVAAALLAAAPVAFAATGPSAVGSDVLATVTASSGKVKSTSQPSGHTGTFNKGRRGGH